MEAWKHKKASPNGGSIEHFDKTCLKMEWEKETLQIAVLKNEITITGKNDITLYCDWAYPCLLEAYKQPMPEWRCFGDQGAFCFPAGLEKLV